MSDQLIGICGALSPGILGSNPQICDLPALHAGWHGADNVTPAGWPSTRTSWVNETDWPAEVAALRQQLDEARGELEHWRSGRRRKGMPVIESVPDGLHYAAELVRAQGTEGGEEHDRLLVEAGMRLKGLHDAAGALLVDRDRLLDVYRAAEALHDAMVSSEEEDDWEDDPLASIAHEFLKAVKTYRAAAPAEPAPGDVGGVPVDTEEADRG